VRVLLVEDDPAIAEPLVDGLNHHGFDVVHVSNGAAAISSIAAESFDIVLLDLGLPDIDGLDVCKTIRATTNVPVIMVTARNDEIDRVVGLELGADDYVVKPFGVRELVARIRAVRRRFDLTTDAPSEIATVEGSEITTTTSSSRIALGTLEIDQRTHHVRLDGVELDLTPKEFGVLVVLGSDPGAVVPRMSIIEQVWDEHWYGPTKTLDVHIAQLRQKLGDPAWIETVRGIGYRLIDPAVAPEHAKEHAPERAQETT
jgi:two-component system, OmpR family, response regulator RegX3